MKPSERITKLQSTTSEGYGHIEEAAGYRVRNLSMADEANAKADAIVRYLDEQHEQRERGRLLSELGLCNCDQSRHLQRKLDAIMRIAESMENSSGSPQITADVEHHLRHWAGKLREAVSGG